MTWFRRTTLLLMVSLGSGWLALTLQAAAQTNGLPWARITTNVPPALPTFRSPVEAFRELLAMGPVERREALSNRPVEVRKQILAKLREYQSLKPEEQELRLRATELQWYLLPLMRMAPADRENRLKLVPQEQRQLVADRLAKWDRLPAPLREQMLNNEMTARYFAQLQAETNREIVLERMSPERRAKLEAGIDEWRRMSEAQRQMTLEGFNAFFELTPLEKQQALSTVSEAELKQLEKTLQAYEKLTPEQRQQCILSFQKFARMSLIERQEFLKNAEHWKLMSPSERDAWRKLVSYAPIRPPLPPHVPPPMPPTLRRTLGEAVATNSN